MMSWAVCKVAVLPARVYKPCVGSAAILHMGQVVLHNLSRLGGFKVRCCLAQQTSRWCSVLLLGEASAGGPGQPVQPGGCGGGDGKCGPGRGGVPQVGGGRGEGGLCIRVVLRLVQSSQPTLGDVEGVAADAG
jgi:hypothetical protein